MGQDRQSVLTGIIGQDRQSVLTGIMGQGRQSVLTLWSSEMGEHRLPIMKKQLYLLPDTM